MILATARRLAALAMAMLALGVGALHAADEAWPTKPIRFVLTFPPGGSADIVARAIAPKAGETLGQPLVIDNRPGAGGNIGMEIVAKAPPDGYTVGLGAVGALASNISLYPSMPYNPSRDFAPVTLVAEIPFVLVGAPDLPAKSLRELLALAKKEPGTLALGHGGNGTAMHLSAELLRMTAGIELTMVAYKGSAPAASDAMAGHVPLAMVDVTSALSFIKAGRVKAFGVTPARRVAALPETPTLAEAGLAGYESSGWFGVVAPSGTPRVIVERLNAAIAGALRQPDIAERIVAAGAEPAPGTSAEFGAFIKSETAKWAKVVAASGARAD
jgi:tripartite-type tricarboxylate transporter receptor subunit TctC